MLDRHYPWSQQLKLLLDFEPVTTRRHLDAVMEDCTKRISLQSPAAHQQAPYMPAMVPPEFCFYLQPTEGCTPQACKQRASA